MFVGNWPSIRALSSPGHTALQDSRTGECSTFSSFSTACNGLSHLFFRDLRIDKGDRIALLSPTRIEYLQIFFAAARIGAVIVPLPEASPIDRLIEIVKDARPSVLICDKSCSEKAGALQSAAPLRKSCDLDVICSENRESLQNKDIPVEEVELFQEDPLLLLYDAHNSGIILSQGAVMWNAFSVSMMYGLNQKDRAPLTFPISSPLGLTLFTLPLFLSGGATLIGQSNAASMMDRMEQDSITFLYMEPDNDLKEVISSLERFSSLRFCAYLDCEESSEYAGSSLARLIPLYCKLEAGPHTFYASPDLSRKNRKTVGHPLPHVEVAIMDRHGKSLPSGQVGELMIRGHHTFSGYWNNPSATRAAFNQGWLRTGDMARCDEGSYFIIDMKSSEAYLSPRKKAAS